jgi:acetyl-CoA carboxylase alpha subunit
VCGEGGSGGALGIAIGDRVLIQQFAIFSVIPPEGCSAILWRDANRKVEAAAALKLTAPDLLKAGIVDEIVREPLGGAHQDPALAAQLVDEAISRALADMSVMPVPARLDHRYGRLRQMGRLGVDFADAAPVADGAAKPAGRASRAR